MILAENKKITYAFLSALLRRLNHLVTWGPVKLSCVANWSLAVICR